MSSSTKETNVWRSTRPTNKRKHSEFNSATPETKKHVHRITSISNAASLRLVPIDVSTKLQRTGQGGVSVRQKTLVFVPEEIVRQIPKYKALLEKAISRGQKEGKIHLNDDDTHDTRAFTQAIEFVGGTPLRPLTGSKDEYRETLEDLRWMYSVGEALEMEKLQEAVIHHIESCPDMPVDVFLDFAKFCYRFGISRDTEQHTVNSPIGKLIRRKLQILLPLLLQDGTAQQIQADGGTLSTQLLQVMIEQFSGKAGVKVEG